MKTVCLLVLTFAAAVLATTPQEKLKEYSDQCLPESGVSQETLTKVRNHEEVDDPKLKAHGLCILKKAGFIGDNGELHVDVIKEKFNKHTDNHDAVEKLVNKCAVKKDSAEDTAAHFFKCIHEAREKAKAH